MEEVKEGVRPKTAERRDTVKEQHPLSLSRRVYDRTLRGLLYLCAGLTCALLLFLIGYIFYRGLPHITWELVSTQESILNDTTGILPSILNTVYVVVVTMLVVLPLGVGAAVYLTEYASNRRLVVTVALTTETLAGIPSIIYAMVGVLIFSQFMSLGKTLLAASLTLVILTLPTIIRTTQESLKTVPQSYREGSLGLGSGKWHMIRTVVLPNSIDGIVTGCILAVGRIVGESAVLMFTAGMSTTLNRFFVWNGDLGASLAQTWQGLTQSSGATLTVALYVFAKERAQFDIAFAIGAILMIITLLINLCAKLVGKKLKK